MRVSKVQYIAQYLHRNMALFLFNHIMEREMCYYSQHPTGIDGIR